MSDRPGHSGGVLLRKILISPLFVAKLFFGIARYCVGAARALWHNSAKWKWYEILLMLGVAVMPSIGEYFLSLVFILLAALSLISKLFHASYGDAVKAVGTTGIIVALGLLVFIVRDEKGSRPWSHLSSPARGLASLLLKPITAPPPHARPLPPTSTAYNVQIAIPLDKEKPDISIVLVHPESFDIVVGNSSNVVMNSPKYWVAVWDLDSINPEIHRPYVLPVPVFGGDWIRAHGSLGPEAVVSLPTVAAIVKPHDRLAGFIGASCPDCKKTKFYWVYAIQGQGGWFSQITNGVPSLEDFSRLIPQIAANPDAFFKSIPIKARMAIINPP